MQGFNGLALGTTGRFPIWWGPCHIRSPAGCESLYPWLFLSMTSHRSSSCWDVTTHGALGCDPPQSWRHSELDKKLRRRPCIGKGRSVPAAEDSWFRFQLLKPQTLCPVSLPYCCLEYLGSGHQILYLIPFSIGRSFFYFPHCFFKAQPDLQAQAQKDFEFEFTGQES